MTTALITLLASLASALTTLAVKWFLDQYDQKERWEREDRLAERRQEREDRTRFHAERRTAYIRYLALAQDLFLSTSVEKMRGPGRGDASTVPPDELAFIDTMVKSELKEVYEMVHLLATPPVRAAAKQLNDCIFAIVRAAYAPDFGKRYKEIGEEMVRVHEAFHAAARAELGIEEIGPAKDTGADGEAPANAMMEPCLSAHADPATPTSLPSKSSEKL